jgi:tetratricopeptide (TPR) repeat protein
VLKKSKNVLKLALILCAAGGLLFAADVKLRIYLQDGTLQSGNLVNETPESFVILTKDGRSEVPKDKIMFINGKTLKQWQERPDKLFSTEILPADIPNPAYVNDKAALPSPPSPSAKSAQLTKKAVSENKSKAVPAVEKPATQIKTPVEAVKGPTAAAATPDTALPLKTLAARSGRRHGHGKHAPSATVPNPSVPPGAKPEGKVTASIKPAPVAAASSARQPTQSVGSAASPVGAPLALPARFSRKEYADVYYQQALRDIEQKHAGAALHELHVAAILDRQDPEPTLWLGKIYLEQGLLSRAHKYLSHPILKKREDAKALLDQIAAQQAQKKKSRRLLYGATVVGIFAWVPLIFLLRKIRRTNRRVITADTEMPSPFAAKPDVVDPTTEILPVVENILAGKPVPAPAPAPVAEPAFMKVPPSAPKAPVSMPPPIAPRPASPIPSPIIPLPVFSKPPQPSAPAPELPTPLTAPASTVNQFIPPSAVSIPDTDAVLRLAGMVEQAVRKGNALAVEEQFTQAAREYRTALALNPACLEAQLGLAYLCFSQGQLDLALEHYERCMKIDPASADAHYGMGRVLLENDRINEAVSEFQQTLTLDPSFDDARETLTSLDALA